MAEKTPLKNKANKAPLKNKKQAPKQSKEEVLKEILEDAKDGVLKDESVDKVKEVLKDWDPKKDKNCAPGMFAWKGSCYQNLRSMGLPLSQARRWYADGKITKVE